MLLLLQLKQRSQCSVHAYMAGPLKEPDAGNWRRELYYTGSVLAFFKKCSRGTFPPLVGYHDRSITYPCLSKHGGVIASRETRRCWCDRTSTMVEPLPRKEHLHVVRLSSALCCRERHPSSQSSGAAPRSKKSTQQFDFSEPSRAEDFRFANLRRAKHRPLRSVFTRFLLDL